VFDGRPVALCNISACEGLLIYIEVLFCLLIMKERMSKYVRFKAFTVSKHQKSYFWLSAMAMNNPDGDTSF
jgi:hypothetical protein